ncbi:MAG: thermonuclease family protein [Candidatus Contendobacter sp.]|nr:thermonuclease family protein [Candidatus Contendobacter sp.]
MIRRIAGSGVLLFLALVVAGIPVSADTLTGRVVAVADGDTLTVLVDDKQPVKVRLAGIDAPERNQPFSAQSREALVSLALDREARVVALTVDRYGRAVGRVMVKQPGGNFTEMDVSHELVARGLAVVYRQYSQDSELLAVEAEAQRERRGVWAGECVKWSCGQMASCEEARGYLARCGVLRLDRDGDGTPCEGLCR